MFDSGISAQTLITALKTEADIAPDIPNSYFIDWLNEVEQTLYDNIIREEHVVDKPLDELCNGGAHDIVAGEFSMLYSVIRAKAREASIDANTDTIRFEDISAILINGRRLSEVTRTTWENKLFPYSYCDGIDRIMLYMPGFTADSQWRTLRARIIYKVRPMPVVAADTSATYANPVNHMVAVPVEFVNMVRARLRGEAYKFANEDALAAKWLNDYNAQLEYFRAWIASKSSTFGV